MFAAAGLDVRSWRVRVDVMQPTVARLTPEESSDVGHAARVEAPRAAHGDWAPASGRRDPVEILVEQATSRVPELVPIRYGRMLATPFTFYRGAAAIMAADLSVTPSTGIAVQACGDAHISNFGGFAAPDRQLVFDLNDFDETLPGPWEWDLKRMAASIEIAGRDRSFKAGVRRTMVADAVREYREALRGFAKQGHLDVWYARMDAEQLGRRFGVTATPEEDKSLRKAMAKARRKDSLRALAKLTEQGPDGRLRFISAPPLIVPVEDLIPAGDAEQQTAAMREMLWSYRSTLPGDRRHLFDRYEFVHLARKVVGVGSVGTRAWVILLEGRGGEEPLVLQAKEAQPSVLEPYVGESEYETHGQRVVEGQRLMQAAGDIFLGWERVTGIDGQERDFYVRQLLDWKGSADISLMSAERLAAYSRACAWTLARAHARSGDGRAIAAYVGGGRSLDKAIAQFSWDYAEQNLLDHEALAEAAADGRIEVETGY